MTANTTLTKRIINLPACNSPSITDVLVIEGNSLANTFKVPVSALLANTANLNFKANTVTIQGNSTPANSTITIEKGRIFYDTTYLYIAVANNTVKRITLEAF